MLHEALALAEASGDREVECKVCRELGFVAVQAGAGCRRAGGWDAPARWRRGRQGARGRARRARQGAVGPRPLRGGDRAARESVAAARRCGDVRQAAWSLAILGRALLLRGQLPEAVEALDDSLALVAEEGWVAFQPFPEALRAEVALRQGDPDRAIALLDHAFALGCRIGDPCWEAIAARARARPRGGGRARRRRWRGCATPPCARCAWPIPTSGCTPTAWRRSPASRSPTLRPMPASAWPSSSGSPPAATCASSSCAPRCTARGSAIPAASRPPACSGEAIDNPALHAELAAAV